MIDAVNQMVDTRKRIYVNISMYALPQHPARVISFPCTFSFRI